MTDTELHCPIDDCATRHEGADELLDHFYTDHPFEELANRLVELAGVLPYHPDVECQICQGFGARPGDHPLCETCEKGVYG